MRGRTNAGGSGNLAIKGDIEQFKVAEGGNVTAGDFVEYSTQKNESVLSYTDFGGGKTIQLEENLVITQDDEALYLLKMVNGTLKIVASYNEKPVGGYCIMSDGGIAVAVKVEPYLIKLKVMDDLFQFVCSAEAGNQSIDTSYGIFVENFGGKLCLMYSKPKQINSANSSYSFNMIYNFLEIQENKFLFNEWKEMNDIFLFYASSLSSGFSFKETFRVGDYIYYHVKYKDSISSSSSTESYIRRFKIDIEANELLSDSTRFLGNVDISPVVFFDRYILIASGDNFFIINSSAGTSISISYNSFGFTKDIGSASPERGHFAFAKYRENKLAMFYYAGYYAKDRYQVAVFEVEEASGNIVRLSEIFKPEFSKVIFYFTRIGVFFLDGIVSATSYVDNATYIYAMSYHENSQQLTDMVDENFVKTYEGGTTMGVAKQSGVSGERIDVYVPKL